MLERQHGHALRVTPDVSSTLTAEFRPSHEESGRCGLVDDKAAEVEVKISLRRNSPLGKFVRSIAVRTYHDQTLPTAMRKRHWNSSRWPFCLLHGLDICAD